MLIVFNALTFLSYMVVGLVTITIPSRDPVGFVKFVASNPSGLTSLSGKVYGGFIIACAIHHLFVTIGLLGYDVETAMLVADGAMAGISVSAAVVVVILVGLYLVDRNAKELSDDGEAEAR